MSWEYLFLALVAVLVILLVLFRKNPYVKLYWKYSLILAPFVILVILKIISSPKPNGTNGTQPGPVVPDPTTRKLEDIKTDITIAQQTAAIEISAAKTKNNEMIKKLEEIQKIPDKKEQVKQLAALIG